MTVDAYSREGYVARCDWTSIPLITQAKSWSFLMRFTNHCEKTFGNRPLNVEITMKKESEKFSAIKAIRASIFTSIKLVV